jgi:hypothetical protein
MPEKETEHLICSLLSLLYSNQDKSQDIAHKKGTFRVAGSRYVKSSESKTGMDKINRKGSKIRPHEFFRLSHRGFFRESMPVLAFLP